MTTSTNLFERWATVYDAEPNPLLALEERLLPSLLPTVSQARVLDVGCGTGRWLERLERLEPAKLTGIDPSTAMLAIARGKLSAQTNLVEGDASELSLPAGSQDLVLVSFVASYIDHFDVFLHECARVLAPGGHLILTDMHPVTATERGWTRSFTQGNQTIHIPAHTRALADIVEACARHGLLLNNQSEAAFDAPEYSCFQGAGKQAAFEKLKGVPAIYLLKLEKQVSLCLTNGRTGAGLDAWSKGPLNLSKGRIQNTPDPEAYTLDLTSYTILPGLINAHDHLEFALFPRLARSSSQPPYRNSTEWASEIQKTHADTIALHRQVPLETRLSFGILRNLLAGVTTVCHHNQLHSALTRPNLPIRIASDIGWAHSIAFEPELQSRFEASRESQPFIIHAAEGIDDQSRDEIQQLDARHLLTTRTVLVHGLALAEQDVALLNRRGSSLILCPTSNHLLFGQSPPQAIIHGVERAALGSDSPLTAAGDLLDEIAFLHHQNVDAGTIFRLVTTGAANTLHLREGQGTLAADGPADLIVVRSPHRIPAEAVANLSMDMIEMIVVGGRIQMASDGFYQALPERLRSHLEPLHLGGLRRWVNAPVHSLIASAEKVLGAGKLCIGHKEVRDGHSI